MIIIGIAGGSGSGKSSLCQRLIDRIGKDQVAHILQDNYYFPKGMSHTQHQQNYDHPDALEFSLLRSHLEAMLQNRAVEIPMYDFAVHDRKVKTRLQQPMPFALVEGILILSKPEIRQFLNLSIFVDAPEHVRFQRRSERDQVSRGRTYESVVEQFEKTVNPMHKLFVEPSKNFADIVVSGEDSLDVSLETILGNIKSLKSRVTVHSQSQ